MNIQAVQSFGSSRNTAGKRPVGASLRRAQPAVTDTFQRETAVSRPQKDKFDFQSKEKNVSKLEKIKKLQQEAFAKERLLYSTYVNDEVRQAILDKKIKENSLNRIVQKLCHNPQFISELFLEKPGGDVMLALPDRVFKRVLKHLPEPEYFFKFALTKDADGRTFIEKASASQIKIFNERTCKYPEVLKKVYLSKNSEGQIPAHYIPPEALDSMNIALSRYPDIIRKIYTTTDKNGNTPAHHRFYYGQAVIAHMVAKDMPTAKILYNTCNMRGELPENALRWAENYKGPYQKTWDYILQNF